MKLVNNGFVQLECVEHKLSQAQLLLRYDSLPKEEIVLSFRTRYHVNHTAMWSATTPITLTSLQKELKSYLKQSHVLAIILVLVMV